MMIVIAVAMTATMMVMVGDAADAAAQADVVEADGCTVAKSAVSASRRLT